MQLFKSRSLKRPIVEENRTAPRFEASDVPNLRIICDGDEPEVKLINISRRGALVESSEPMWPGTSICLQLAMGENKHFIRGKITEDRFSSMSGRVFKIAIAFDEEFTHLPSSDNLLEDEDFLE